MTDTQAILEQIDPVVDEILHSFDVDKPPVPVELMLQRPRENTWTEIDLSEMSATFLNLLDRFAPRMSAVRLLARHIIRSEWGAQRGLSALPDDIEAINIVARAIIIPRQLLDGIALEDLDSITLSLRFEVPPDDVQARLADLGFTETGGT